MTSSTMTSQTMTSLTMTSHTKASLTHLMISSIGGFLSLDKIFLQHNTTHDAGHSHWLHSHPTPSPGCLHSRELLVWVGTLGLDDQTLQGEVGPQRGLVVLTVHWDVPPLAQRLLLAALQGHTMIVNSSPLPPSPPHTCQEQRRRVTNCDTMYSN